MRKGGVVQRPTLLGDGCFLPGKLHSGNNRAAKLKFAQELEELARVLWCAGRPRRGRWCQGKPAPRSRVL